MPTFKSGHTNLFIEGGAASGSMELYTKATMGIDWGATYFNIWGHSPASGNIPLHVKSGRDFQTLNLYVDGFGEEVTGSTKLFTYGEGSGITNPSGAYNVANLFLQVDDELSDSMNLVALGPSSSGVSDSMKLYLEVNPLYNETGTEITGNADLFIENKLVLSSGYIPIFAGGKGVPASGNMNLFVARDIESVKDNVELYVSGPITGPTGVATLYSVGEIRVASGDMTMVMPDVISSASGDTTLYTFGYTE
jgi:hypothetical protein